MSNTEQRTKKSRRSKTMTEEMTNVVLELSEIEKQVSNIISENIDLKEENKQAKEIIRELLTCARNYPESNKQKMQKAEAFLKE